MSIITETRKKRKSTLYDTNPRQSFSKFSPVWVVHNPKDALGYKLELIKRIRERVKKEDWKALIAEIGASCSRERSI